MEWLRYMESQQADFEHHMVRLITEEPSISYLWNGIIENWTDYTPLSDKPFLISSGSWDAYSSNDFSIFWTWTKHGVIREWLDTILSESDGRQVLAGKVVLPPPSSVTHHSYPTPTTFCDPDAPRHLAYHCQRQNTIPISCPVWKLFFQCHHSSEIFPISILLLLL